MKTFLCVPRNLLAAVIVLLTASAWHPFVAAEAGSQSAGQPQSAATININEASAARIAEVLDGIGEKRAQAIVDYREKHGAFESLDDLAAVKGVGEKTLEDNAGRITF